MSSRKGQVAVFVIIALVIVVAVVGYFVVWKNVGSKGYPEEFDEVFDYYQSCIE